VARCHDAGLAVHAWTCNDAERLVELLAAGTDGVCTDVPDTALAALGRAAGRRSGAVTPRWGRPA
jgi:glycerophosphoryl diester phosphodiesterase